MIKLLILPLVSFFGIYSAITVIQAGNTPPPVNPPFVEPVLSPFLKNVSGSGIVESSSENIKIAPSLNGVIEEIYIKVGDTVEKGTPILKLDTRQIEAELATSKAEIELQLAQLKSAESRLALVNSIQDKRAISEDILTERKNNVQISKANYNLAQAKLHALEIQKQLAIVLAPRAGKILQLNCRVGEFASTGQGATYLVLFGTTDPLNIRVDIDESDARYVKGTAPAVASIRGESESSLKLSFVRFEPYVVPKKSLTGDSSERVDTRVLQVIYRIDDAKVMPYVGQMVDVLIER